MREPIFYEPFEPYVGQRVRIRLNPECDAPCSYDNGKTGPIGECFAERIGHDPGVDGQTGWIHDLDPPLTDDIVAACSPSYDHPDCFDAHRVQVQFDAPVTVEITDEPQWYEFFAVSELEPLDYA